MLIAYLSLRPSPTNIGLLVSHLKKQYVACLHCVILAQGARLKYIGMLIAYLSLRIRPTSIGLLVSHLKNNTLHVCIVLLHKTNAIFFIGFCLCLVDGACIK